MDGLHQPAVWEDFFAAVKDTSRYRVCVHAKHTMNPSRTPAFLRDAHIPDWIPTQWGDISLVKATLLLIRAALSIPEMEHCILVSPSCIPIVSFATLEKTLIQHTSCIHYKHLSNKLNRYQLLHPHVKTRLPWDKFYCQYQWMALCRRHAEKLWKTRHYVNFFLRVPAVDEHYFICVLYLLGCLKSSHSHPKNKTLEVLPRKITYCDWSDSTSMHPREFKEITKHDLRRAYQQGCCFLRKVTATTRIPPGLACCLRD